MQIRKRSGSPVVAPGWKDLFYLFFGKPFGFGLRAKRSLCFVLNLLSYLKAMLIDVILSEQILRLPIFG